MSTASAVLRPDMAADAWLDAAALPARWGGYASFVVLDTDFADGARFLATWEAWQDDVNAPKRLHYLALANTSLAMPAGLPAELREQWPLALPGVHRLLLEQGRVMLDLMIGAPDQCLAQSDAIADMIYLSCAGVAPAMLVKRARPGTVLAAAPGQDTQLERAGFAGGHTGAADQSALLRRVFATRRPQTARPAAPTMRRAVVIGAGLAGSAACERLCARGWQVTLIEQHKGPAQEASGNLAGIFMPLLSRDDNLPTRLSRASYLFALRRWHQLGGIGDAIQGARCGVLQLARDAGHAVVQRDIVASGQYPPEYVRWLDPAQASATLGAAAPHGGWLFGQGGWVNPGSVCAAMLASCGSRLERCFASTALRLERAGDGWQVFDVGGALLAEAPVVVLANGTGATGLRQAAQLPLDSVRGQVTHLAADQAPALPLVVCREAYLTPAAGGVVCVGATYDADPDRSVRSASQQENLARMAGIIGSTPVDPPLAGRTGFRCVAPDRLALVGALPDYGASGPAERLRDMARWPGLYCLLGYASRGLTWAPLAAELLAAQLEGEAAPLEAVLVAALDPGRFLLKQRRRGLA